MDAIEGLLEAASGHLFEGRLTEAREALRGLLAIDGDVVPALELLAAVEEAAGDGEARAEALGRLIRNTFDTAALGPLSRDLADVLDALGRPDEALSHHARYLQLVPFDLAHWRAVSPRLSARIRGELLEARVDAAEDASLPEARTRALLEAAAAHAEAGQAALAADAVARISLPEAQGDPELLLSIFDLATRYAVVPLQRSAARALAPLLLPGPELTAVEAALSAGDMTSP
jgi:hypothetical protein